MARVLVILGAGASAATGAPLMNGFVERSRSLFNSNAAIDRQAFEAVLRLRRELEGLHGRTENELDNFEAIYNLVEMGKLLDLLPNGRTGRQIVTLSRQMATVLAETVELSCLFRAQDGVPQPHGYYMSLLAKVLEAKRNNRSPDWTFVTFNYDIALDFALATAGLGPDYCIDNTEKRPANAVRLLKLHGSLNWTRCKCGKPFAFGIPIDPTPTRTKTIVSVRTEQPIVVTKAAGKANHGCGKASSGELMIIPPSWNKTQYHRDIVGVWRAAAKEFLDAEQIVVAGYSMPATDEFFRDMLRIGLDSTRNLQRLTVVNTDATVTGKFGALMGKEMRGKFVQVNSNFELFVESLVRELG